MRYILASTIFVLFASSVMALDATDTMQAWNSANPSDRTELLDKLSKAGSERSSKEEVSTCMNDAGKMGAHANLVISEVYEACSKQSVRDNI
jgi:hypothetical protein